MAFLRAYDKELRTLLREVSKGNLSLPGVRVSESDTKAPIGSDVDEKGSTMAKKKIHWPTVMTLYFIIGIGLATLGFALRRGSPVAALHAALLGGLALLVILAIVVVGLFLLRRRFKTVGGKLLSKVSEWWHFELGWFGAGLASFGIASLFHSVPASSAPVAAIMGPLAFLTLPSSFFVLVCLAAITLGFEEVLRKLELHKHDGGKNSASKVAKKIKEAAGKDTEKAPSERPDGAEFVSVEKDVSAFVIPEDQLGKRVSVGVASLAPAWGKLKRDVEFGLPKEGSAIAIGAPGSGKSLMIIRSILNITGDSPMKLVVTSTKPRDISGPVTKHLREQGFRVRMIDLTGSIGEDTQYGDPTYWSPLSLCLTDDSAKKTSERLVAAAQDSDSRVREEFWSIQTGLLLWPNLVAAVIANKDLEWAYRSTLQWSDPNFDETDRILFAASREDALRAWQGTRKFLLDKENDWDWKEKNGMSGAGGTGMSIDATLRGLMNRIATESAYRATAHPNLILNEWVTSDQKEVLFLVGDMSEEYTTRSLFAVAMNELLTEATKLARTQPNERLPFQMVVFADEMANLTPVDGIERFYATVRSINLQIIAFFQSRAQIVQMLGEQAAEILIGAAALMVLLPGLNDSNLIGHLERLGGRAQKEFNEDDVRETDLISGSYIMAMQAPNFETGEPGDALALTKGGFTELKIPWWSLEKNLFDRGVVPFDYHEETMALRRSRRSNVEKVTDFLREKSAGLIRVPITPNPETVPTSPSADPPKQWVKSTVTDTPTDSPKPVKLVRSTMGTATLAQEPITRPTNTPEPTRARCSNEHVDLFSGEILRCGVDGYRCDKCQKDSDEF